MTASQVHILPRQTQIITKQTKTRTNTDKATPTKTSHDILCRCTYFQNIKDKKDKHKYKQRQIRNKNKDRHRQIAQVHILPRENQQQSHEQAVNMAAAAAKVAIFFERVEIWISFIIFVSNFCLRVELWRSLIIFVSFFVWELGFEEVWSISYRFLFENWALNGFYFYGKVCKRIKQWWDSPSDVPTCIFTGVRNRQRVVIVESWQSAISSGPLEIAPGGFLWTRRWNVPVKNGPQWCR